MDINKTNIFDFISTLQGDDKLSIIRSITTIKTMGVFTHCKEHVESIDHWTVDEFLEFIKEELYETHYSNVIGVVNQQKN